MDIFTAFSTILVIMTYYLHEFHWTYYDVKVSTVSFWNKVSGFTGESKGRGL